MKTVIDLTLSFDKLDGEKKRIAAKQLDRLSRVLRVKLTKSNGSFKAPEGAEVRLRGTKPNGLGFDTIGRRDEKDASVYEFALDDNILASAGRIICDVACQTGVGEAMTLCSTELFEIEALSAAIDADTATDSEDFKSLEAAADRVVKTVDDKLHELDTLKTEVQDAKQTADTAAENASKTLSFANEVLAEAEDIESRLSVLAYTMPQYVIDKAEETAKKVQSHQKAHTFTLVAASDLHYSVDEPNASVTAIALKNCAQGMEAVKRAVFADGCAILGDFLWDFAEDNESAMRSLRRINGWFWDAVSGVQNFRAKGNHDLVSATQMFNAQLAFNDGAVFDDEAVYNGYCYKDYDRKKIRVILLNTATLPNGNAQLGDRQIEWLKEALKLPTGFKSIILSHHPLDWLGEDSEVMRAVSSAGGVICNIHGHTHNFLVSNLAGTDIKRIAIPNANPYRNNEYAQNGSPDSNGIDYGEYDADGTPKTFNKTMGTAENTAFCVLTVDTESDKIYADCYGAGYDRVIEFSASSGSVENLLDTAYEVTNRNAVYNGGLGYKNGVYVSGAGIPWESADAAFVSTGCIDYNLPDTGLPSTIYIKGNSIDWNASHTRMAFLVENGGLQHSLVSGEIADFYDIVTLADSYYRLTPKAAANTSALYDYIHTQGNGKAPSKAVVCIKMSVNGTGENLFISLDRPIV